MAGENGEAGTQNGGQGNNDTHYKSFKTEQDFNQAKDKIYKNGYSEAQSKVLSRIGETIGSDVKSLDEVITQINDYKKKLSEQISDPTATDEYKELQDKLKEANKQAELAKAEKSNIENQYDVDSDINKGLVSIKEAHKLNISESDVKDLFNTRYKTEKVDGRLIAKKFDDSINDYKAVTDENGNYKPLHNVFTDFAKNYATPKAEGTGGESGEGGGTSKVKVSEYNKALKENNERAAKLFAQGEENGWIEDRDIPK